MERRGREGWVGMGRGAVDGGSEPPIVPRCGKGDDGVGWVVAARIASYVEGAKAKQMLVGLLDGGEGDLGVQWWLHRAQRIKVC